MKYLISINLMVLFLFLYAPYAMADVAGDLNGFFGSLGFDGTITEPTAYQGQAAGYYSGGSLFLRNRVRNIQIINIDAPKMNSGCAGIDMYLGGFSFVNTEAISGFFQRIMNNASGYMFNLALETVVPEIAHSMQYIQDIAQKINANNFNSCELAETFVGGMWPKMRNSQEHVCKDIGSHKNVFSDWAAARQGCKSVEGHDEVVAKAGTDPEYKLHSMKDKNLIWEALLRSGFVHSDIKLAEFLMSLSGTIIYDSGGSTKIYMPTARDNNLINALLVGGTANIYACDSAEKCLNPKIVDMSISKDQALYHRVNRIINEIVIALRTPDIDRRGLDAKAKVFLEFTKLPILKFVISHLMAGNVAPSLSISSYSEAIAKSFLMEYMIWSLDVVEKSLSGMDYAPEIHTKLTDQIRRSLVYVQRIRTDSRSDIQELMQLINNSKVVEREVSAKITGQIKNNLGAK